MARALLDFAGLAEQVARKCPHVHATGSGRPGACAACIAPLLAEVAGYELGSAVASLDSVRSSVDYMFALNELATSNGAVLALKYLRKMIRARQDRTGRAGTVLRSSNASGRMP